MDGKRIRSTNFSNTEKMLLISIISKYKHIVENKKTSSLSIDQKNKTWDKICEEFNASSPESEYRSTESLKKMYDNKKKEVRKIAALERRDGYITGGGRPANIKKDPSYELVLSIINEKTVFGMVNPFDTDADPILKDSSASNGITELELCRTASPPITITCEEEENVPPEQLTASCSNTEKVDYIFQSNGSNLMSEQLKRPKPNDFADTPTKFTATNSRRRRPAIVKSLTTSELSEKYLKLVDRRLEISELEKRNLENDYLLKNKEHNLKIKLSEEEHLRKMKLLDLEIALKAKELERLNNL